MHNLGSNRQAAYSNTGTAVMNQKTIRQCGNFQPDPHCNFSCSPRWAVHYGFPSNTNSKLYVAGLQVLLRVCLFKCQQAGSLSIVLEPATLQIQNKNKWWHSNWPHRSGHWSTFMWFIRCTLVTYTKRSSRKQHVSNQYKVPNPSWPFRHSGIVDC